MSKQLVSKRHSLGKPIVIFVTVGTTPFQFDRLFQSLDAVLKKIKSNAEVILQYGNSSIRYKEYKMYDVLSPKDMVSSIKKADKIITHGGISTLNTISMYSTIMPLSVSRLKAFNEHVNDHQKHFLLYVKKKFPIEYQHYFITDHENLELQIGSYILEKPLNNVFSKYLLTQSKKDSLLKKLDVYIQSI